MFGLEKEVLVEVCVLGFWEMWWRRIYMED